MSDTTKALTERLRAASEALTAYGHLLSEAVYDGSDARREAMVYRDVLIGAGQDADKAAARICDLEAVVDAAKHLAQGLARTAMDFDTEKNRAHYADDLVALMAALARVEGQV